MVNCDYCGEPAEKVTGKVIYPHRPDLYRKLYYNCAACEAYVGCHPGSSVPLGRLANKELRAAKRKAHLHFDELWKSNKMSRSSAYEWLSKALNISRGETHIGMFDLDKCKNVVKAVTEFNSLEKKDNDHVEKKSVQG